MKPATLLSVLVALITVAYPAVVFFGHAVLDPRWLALGLVLLAVLRAWASQQALWWLAAVGALALAAGTAWGGGWLPLKLYPVWVNAVLLLVFGWSLWRGPPVIEQLARLSEPELPPRAVAYTRQVTQVWCGFFVLNGSVAAYTALACNEQTWAIYNGVVAYVLMGLLFGIEWCVRQRVKASVEHG
ncbi:COG4648 family protein [Ideonella paludis]|uniref:COG4648 family protein n=1 Tax=Ideonella paludis TaxID=1233411 RepID=UPI002873481C|nr:hypothetical protein [Ideonella paludis]